MIGRLTGTLVEDEGDGGIVLDVGGVGYELRTPLGTAGRAPRDAAGRLALSTYLHVREDALELYGFASELERRVFRLLLDVPNVGPKTALGVLSALPPPDLAAAVAARDVARLTRVDGVGKKTAERLVLELHERLPKLGVVAARGAPRGAPPGATSAKLTAALIGMGYRPAESEAAVGALGERPAGEPLADQLKAALAWLSR